MQNNNLKISVVMSVYNGEKYLKLAIESILNQSFRDFEFLIIDDCSKDKTPNILSQYAEKDSRINVLRNPQNLGLTKSLNRGLNNAKGRYIARMDSDDVSTTERLKKQLGFMEQNPSVALCGSLALVINEQGEEIGRKNLAVKYQDIKNKLLFNNQFIHSSLFFKKELGLYNESFERAQDYEFILRQASRHQVANLPEYLVKWRVRNGSLSFSGTKQQTSAIKARWLAITRYGYPKLRGVFHILLRIGWLLTPKFLKNFVTIYSDRNIL